MTEIQENVTRGGILLRIVIAVLFFAAAAIGALMAFGPALFPSSSEDLTANAEPIVDSSQKKPEEKLFIIAVGDMMLDRNVLNLTEKSGNYAYPFGKIDEYLSRADLRVGNLEGPITDNKSLAVKNNGMRFTFPTDYLIALTGRFEVLGIGNNHMLDFGEEGLRQTKNNLTRSGIAFFGDYLNRGDNNSVVVKKNGIKIGFVGYHSLTGQNLDNVIIDTARLRTMCDFVIAMPHWGEEYKLEPNVAQEDVAEKLIDAGADAVIGGHPHVAQPVSVYKGKPIFWSLGNFIFDQYFSEETMRAISATIEVEKKDDGTVSAKYGIVPIAIGRDSKPQPMEGDAAKAFLNDIASRSNVTETGKADIQAGKFDPVTAEKKSL